MADTIICVKLEMITSVFKLAKPAADGYRQNDACRPSPSIHIYDCVFIHSGLSAEWAIL